MHGVTIKIKNFIPLDLKDLINFTPTSNRNIIAVQGSYTSISISKLSRNATVKLTVSFHL